MEFEGRPKLGGRVLAVLGLLAVVGVVAGYGVAQRGRPQPVRIALDPTPSPTEGSGRAIYVHVAGGVREPGLYRLEEGERVDDAVRAAGGPLEIADLDAVNLAAKLKDGDKVLVPVIGGEVGEEGGPGGGGKVNLNTADGGALETLPGIGPALSTRILAYREEHGGFRAVEDLLKVSGIGPRTFEVLSELVTV